MNDENWKRYKSHISKSSSAVWAVAKYIHSLDISVTVNKTEVAPSKEEYYDYVDDGDIIAHTSSGDKIIEVKNVSLEFESHEDFIYDTFIVCAKRAFDRHETKPYAYFLVNKNMTHAMIVKSETKDSWQVKELKDHRYQNWEQKFYISNHNIHKIIKL